MACRDTTQAHLCASLTPALDFTCFFQCSIFKAFFYEAPIHLAAKCEPSAVLVLRLPLFKAYSFQPCSRALCRSTYFFPGMKILHLRSSVINNSDSCLFSCNTMANLDEQVSLGTEGTTVPKGQPCRHKDPQAHLIRHLP
jgi:hypothetical protein